MAFHVIIPARFASTRLPGKPLADIAGKPMIQHVYERAKQSQAQSVTIATDDNKIQVVGKKLGAIVCITSDQHHSGTERVAEAAQLLNLNDNDIVVNVQGDEPLVSPLNINQVAETLKNDTQADMATLCQPILNTEDIFNPNVVKVVLDIDDCAIYFSRAPIPWDRSRFPYHQNESQLTNYFRHLGMYAYRVSFLKKYLTWSVTELEQLESLEQLRALWQRSRIKLSITKDNAGPSVDTEQDLLEVRELFKKEMV